MARLVGSSGKCPCPGIPLSVKAAKPGSPVRSLPCRVMVQPLGAPTRLLSSEVTRSEQSGTLPVLRARMVFCNDTVPRDSLARPPPRPKNGGTPDATLLATVQLVRVTVPSMFQRPPPSNSARLSARVLLV